MPTTSSLMGMVAPLYTEKSTAKRKRKKARAGDTMAKKSKGMGSQKSPKGGNSTNIASSATSRPGNRLGGFPAVKK